MISTLKKEVELLERHAKILKLVMENQPVGIIRLAELSNLPQHKVRYSLRILEKSGLIKPSPQGAVITENAGDYIKKIRDEIEEIHKKLGEIAELIK